MLPCMPTVPTSLSKSEGSAYRNVAFLSQLCKFLFCIRYDYSVTGYNQRPFCPVQQFCRLFYFIFGCFWPLFHYAFEQYIRVIAEICPFCLGILGDTYNDRPWFSALGDIESLRHCFGDFRSIGYLIVPFRNRTGYPDHIGFLEKVGPQLVCIDLCSYADYRSGVHHRIGNAGYEVCGSRSRSGNAYACFSGASCIPFGCMNRTLLVPYKYMVDFVGVVV